MLYCASILSITSEAKSFEWLASSRALFAGRCSLSFSESFRVRPAAAAAVRFLLLASHKSFVAGNLQECFLDWHLWHPVPAGALTGTRPSSTVSLHSAISFQSTSQFNCLALQASHLASPCKTLHCFEGPSSSSSTGSLLSESSESTLIPSVSSSPFSTDSALDVAPRPACHQLPVLPYKLLDN